MSTHSCSEELHATLQIKQLAKTIGRQKAFIVIVALLGGVFAGFVGFAIPPSYTATAQVIIDPSRTNAGMEQAGQSTANESVIDTHLATLASEAHLRSVRDNLLKNSDFQIDLGDPQNSIRAFITRLRAWAHEARRALESAIQGPNPSTAMDEQIATQVPSIAEIKRNLRVYQEKRSHVLSVSYISGRPERAAAIANEIVSLYVEEARKKKRRHAELLQAWLDDRLARAGTELEAAEKAVQAYRVARGPSLNDDTDIQLIAEVKHSLALARSAIPGEKPNSSQDKYNGKRQANAKENLSDGPGQFNHDALVLQSQVQMMEQHLKALESAAADRMNARAEFQALERRAASVAKLSDELFRRQQNVLEEGLVSDGGVDMLAPAQTPMRPSSISPLLFIPAALIGFCFLGMGLAVFRDKLDLSLRTERDVANALNLPCIGVIPEAPMNRDRPNLRRLEPRTVYSEAVRSLLVTVLGQAGNSSAQKAILITSAVSNEGATDLVVSIALCAARLGRRVLLIDFDERGTSSFLTHQRALALEGSESIEDLLASGAVEFQSDLGFHVLSACKADPAALYLTGALVKIVHGSKGEFDCIIIASAPVLESIDAALLANVSDEVILAIRWGVTSREVVRDALQVLGRPKASAPDALPNISAVLTRVDLKRYVRYGGITKLPMKHGKNLLAGSGHRSNRG